MISLSSEDFHLFIQSDSLTIIEFWSASCFFCVEAEKYFMKLEQVYRDKCFFAKIDVIKDLNLANKYQVIKLPTIVFFRNSNEIERITGFKNKENAIEKAIRLNY
ncbi:MAG: thioredoxin family protein [Candidatus Nanoarchaeia archaeon]|jgi:thioredoxin 1|nr:thioredoxin family protein [Candidatus Nanoarchaeia archaeon]